MATRLARRLRRKFQKAQARALADQAAPLPLSPPPSPPPSALSKSVPPHSIDESSGTTIDKILAGSDPVAAGLCLAPSASTALPPLPRSSIATKEDGPRGLIIEEEEEHEADMAPAAVASAVPTPDILLYILPLPRFWPSLLFASKQLAIEDDGRRTLAAYGIQNEAAALKAAPPPHAPAPAGARRPPPRLTRMTFLRW